MTTPRERAKADRRSALLAAAARLFAERGYERVSLEELGAAAGVSGPAIYRHFAGKQAVLTELLAGWSERLLDRADQIVAAGGTADHQLRALIAAHLDFAVAEPFVIRVQDRDLDSLPDAERHRIRRTQRTYIERWADVLGPLHADESRETLVARAQAGFGLMNSTPYSARSVPARAVLERMTLAALLG